MTSLALLGCDFRKPINKDLSTGKDITTSEGLTAGIMTKPEGLSCDDVWISIDEEKTDRITFIYGETFYTEDVYADSVNGIKLAKGLL